MSHTVAIVTGASRGAGRGMAVALGAHGATVYVTGRSQQAGDHALPGTIHETAAAVTAAGGKGVPVRCDHADDAEAAALFDRVVSEQGRLDILVNNAAAVHDELSHPGNFWEEAAEACRHDRCRRSQQLRGELVGRSDHGSARPGPHRLYLSIGRSALFDGPPRWRSQGRQRQDGVRYGGRQPPSYRDTHGVIPHVHHSLVIR